MNEAVLGCRCCTAAINLAKAQLLMKENCLEVITKTYDIDKIGGMDKLKRWVISRQKLFTKEAQEANIQCPPVS